jgi:hypothetical protein
VVQGIWGLNDIVADLADLDEENGGFAVPTICNIIDIIDPIAVEVPAAAGRRDRRRVRTFFVPVVNALAGLANTILSATYTGLEKNGDWQLGIAATVIGNVSYMIAPLAAPPLPGLSEDLSVGLKTLVDGLANVTTAILIAEATTLPPK